MVYSTLFEVSWLLCTASMSKKACYSNKSYFALASRELCKKRTGVRPKKVNSGKLPEIRGPFKLAFATKPTEIYFTSHESQRPRRSKISRVTTHGQEKKRGVRKEKLEQKTGQQLT